MALSDNIKTGATLVSIGLAIAGFSYGLGGKGEIATVRAENKTAIDAQNTRIAEFKTDVTRAVDKIEASAKATEAAAKTTAEEAEKTRKSVERLERGGGLRQAGGKER